MRKGRLTIPVDFRTRTEAAAFVRLMHWLALDADLGNIEIPFETRAKLRSAAAHVGSQVRRRLEREEKAA